MHGPLKSAFHVTNGLQDCIMNTVRKRLSNEFSLCKINVIILASVMKIDDNVKGFNPFW